MNGLPLALGTCDLPTKRISTSTVTTYGIIDSSCVSKPEEPPSTVLRPEQKPKSRQPISAPCGRNLPKMTAAIAMKPCPTIEIGRN